MAPKKSSRPFGQVGSSGGAQATVGHGGSTPEEFTGFLWRSVVNPTELEELKVTYRIPSKVDFVVPFSTERAVNSKGYGTKVLVYPIMFSCGLRLPFCRPMREVLGFFKLTPAQLTPSSWRILISCCVI